MIIHNIWAVGRNYADHAREMNAEIPKTPMFFLKAGTTVNAGSVIELPHWSNEIHYELELAYWIDEDLSFSHVTLALDLTARDAQAKAKEKGQPWTLAKSFKGSCPMGSWLSLDEVNDTNHFTFDLKINKNTVQTGSLQDMIFKPALLLDYVKAHFPVVAHDVILTGTPAGVGPLKSGDVVQAELRLNQDAHSPLLTCHWDVK